MIESARGAGAVAALMLCSLALGCASFDPAPLDEVPFRERAQTKTLGGVSVSVSVLGGAETREAFGVSMDRKGIQPVWLRIRNDEDVEYIFFTIELDPLYFSAYETSWKNHFFLGGAENRKMDDYMSDQQIDVIVPPRDTLEGFVYTNRDEGAKFVSVVLLGDNELREFNFTLEVPGLSADYKQVDFDSLYAEDEIVEVDLAGLRKVLEDIPCCALGGDRKTPGDPLNLVVVSDGERVLSPFVHRGWHLTEVIRAASVWGTIRSSLFRSRYRHSPVSPLYLFGRPQDVALQKTRESVDERNHLRLWLSPYRLDGKEVWVGQISRDIGVRLSRKTVVTHKIDPEVDEARTYIAQDLLLSQDVGEIAFVKGVGPAHEAEPRHNYTGDPYFTDGLRAVFFFSDAPTSLSEIELRDWEHPPARWE